MINEMRIDDEHIEAAARQALDACRSSGCMVVTAESCTGGLVAGALTAIAGSSDVVDRGFVTYSNAAKRDLLGVLDDTLKAHGAVSPQTAQAMAEGALSRSAASIAVSITGIAGPGGGSDLKPVGLVEFACARTGRPTLLETRRFGDIGRSAIRRLSVLVALDLIRRQAEPMASRP
jgi:nicotinamide-nucleotide amidase